MNDKRNHSKTYTYADIKEYLDGNMSLDEMYAFEKAVMDDPFLADALDGYMALKHRIEKDIVQDDLKDLGERLRKISKQSPARNFVLPLWAKSAAAVILLIFLGYLTDKLLLNKKPASENIAKKERQTTTQHETPARNQSTGASADSVEIHPKDNKSNPTAPIQSRKAEDRNRHIDSKAAPTPQMKTSVEKKIQPDSVKSAANRQADISKNATADEEKLTDKDLALKQRPSAAAAVAPNEQEFRGVLIDANSMPVQGAVIKLSNSNKVVTTDKLGEFNLGIKHKEPKINLEVNALGYRPRIIEIAPNDLGRNIIELSPDSSYVKEMVVSEYREKQLRESNVDLRNSVDLNASLAAPSGGWQAFYEYLNRNKKINTTDSSKKGTEIISFQVDKNGKLSSFRAEQSVSKAHHAEAIRLIKEGPSWTCLKGKKQRIIIYINFN